MTLRIRHALPWLSLSLAVPVAAASLSDRLTEPKLSALRKSRTALQEASAKAVRPDTGYTDVRCILHAHSSLSHDSRGTEAEIVAAARAAGVRAVFMTEHPTADRKWFTQGLRGVKDGVLFVPGAELSDGLLLWKTDGAEWTPEMKTAEVLRKVKPDAVTFIAHPEQRKDDAAWDLPPFTGMEIYNAHADAMDSGYEEFLKGLREGGVFKLLTVFGIFKRYPIEAYASIFDEQKEVLARWDRLNAGLLERGEERRVVGIAANDAHQNVGIRVALEGETVRVTDALGALVSEIPRAKVPLLLLGKPAADGTTLDQRLDPYPVSFGYVSTHLLVIGADPVTETKLFEALKQGRAYVAFDWMADPTGFQYTATSGNSVRQMGEGAMLKDEPTLTAKSPIPATLRLMRNGAEVARAEGDTLTHAVKEPGVYRVEAWLTVAGEPRPWIYGNPIFIR